ncbi:7501_t:CDS:2, partial [Gigaspora margarita]
MKPHVDEHYCLALVKMTREFAATFANYSLIISQDDKAKVSLGILAISRTFRCIQTFNEPITISDYDFPSGSKQKLIPSVYLIINLKDTNKTLYQAYNPVEQSMYTFSEKLSGIELPIDEF